MSSKFYILLLIIPAFLLMPTLVCAQTTPRSLLWEPEISLKLPKKGNWSFSFGAANRYLLSTQLAKENLKKDEQQHIELNHFTGYKLNSQAAVALGLRYRFREAFNDTRHDELRIIEQFSFKHSNVLLNPAHRIRFEQRFRENTIFRFRYRIGISQALSEAFELDFSTEFLHSMTKDFRPETDQRFTLKLENTSFKNLELFLGAQLRREDYTGNPQTNIHLLSGFNLQL